MEENIFAAVVEEIAGMAEVPRESITLETSLADLGLDSLQALQLLVSLEKWLGIELQEADLAMFSTVASVVEVTNRRLQEARLAVHPSATLAGAVA